MDFAARVYLPEAPSPPDFYLGWSSNFVGSETGQIQSVKLLENMVSNRTQHPHPLPCSHTLSAFFDTEKRGESWAKEKVRGATKLGWKYKHFWLYLQSINSDKHLPKNPLKKFF